MVGGAGSDAEHLKHMQSRDAIGKNWDKLAATCVSIAAGRLKGVSEPYSADGGVEMPPRQAFLGSEIRPPRPGKCGLEKG